MNAASPSPVPAPRRTRVLGAILCGRPLLTLTAIVTTVMLFALVANVWAQAPAATPMMAPPTAAGPTPAPTPLPTNSNLQAWLGVDIIQLILSSDMLGKVSLIVLALISISSWMVIIYKFFHIRQALIQTEEFVELCNQSSGELEEAFRIAAKFPDSPLAQILREGYLELEIENWYRDGYDLDSTGRLELAKVGIERVFERTITNEINHLESKLIILATVTNVCPFIGLFGTVWGIMGAFQAISKMSSGMASLSSLAPDISTALLCTVGGLFCAIPSSVMFNYFTHQVQYLISRMDAFALELSNVINKQILKQSVGSSSIQLT